MMYFIKYHKKSKKNFFFKKFLEIELEYSTNLFVKQYLAKFSDFFGS